MVYGGSDQCRCAIFQQGEHSDWITVAVLDGSRPTSRLAENFYGEPEAQFRLAARHGDYWRRGCVHTRIPRVLFAGLPDFMRIRRVYDHHGILSRCEGDSREVGSFAFHFRGGFDDAQHAALWRVHRAHGHGAGLHRPSRSSVQSRYAEGDATRFHDANRTVHAAVAECRHQAGKELHGTTDDHRSPGRWYSRSRRGIRWDGRDHWWEVIDDAVSGEAAFRDHRGKRHDGSDLLDAERRFIRGVRRAEPGHATSGHSCVSESAGEVDLAGRGGGGPWHAGGAAAESARGAGAGGRACAVD